MGEARRKNKVLLHKFVLIFGKKSNLCFFCDVLDRFTSLSLGQLFKRIYLNGLKGSLWLNC